MKLLLDGVAGLAPRLSFSDCRCTLRFGLGALDWLGAFCGATTIVPKLVVLPVEADSVVE